MMVGIEKREWSRVIAAEDLGVGTTWAARLENFYEWQTARWPALADARNKLDVVRTREIEVDGRSVIVQWNPARVESATAKVDDETIRRRECFLCPENQPNEEWGLAFGHELMILANPAPIVGRHFVLAHRCHRAQLLGPVIASLIAAPEDSAGTITTLYNGPRSGASAPDHLHLQAIASGVSPLERRFRDQRLSGRADLEIEEVVNGGHSFAVGVERWAGRTAIFVRGPGRALEPAIEAVVATWTELDGQTIEGPINAIAFWLAGESIVVIFPRAAHRPACYHQGRVLVSPGALDMAGLFVTIREQDFELFDSELVQEIFAETSISETRTKELASAIRARFGHG